MKFYRFADIAAAADCAAFARDIYGAKISPHGRCNAAWRDGDGSENVNIDKDKFFDHVQKSGGGIVQLAAFKFGGDIQQAQAFLGEYYNLTPHMETGAAPPSRESRYDALLREGYEEVARYDYIDANGETVHFVCRLQHPEKPGKQFCQGRLNGDGKPHWGLHGVETILYNLPAVTASPYAVIVEGEKAANRLISLGIPATTCCGGAKKWRDDLSESLYGKDVAIFPDNDDPGREHAQLVARSLHNVASSVRIIPPPSSAPKAGIDDWLDESPSRAYDDIIALISAAPEWNPPQAPKSGTDEPSPSTLAEAKSANTEPFRNYIPTKVEVEKGRGQHKKMVEEIEKEPRTHQAMIDDLNRRFLGFPRKVGDKLLFDHDRDTGKIIYLHDSDSLMAWIARRAKRNPEWSRGDAMATQKQFIASVRVAAHRYESISLIPSWPPRRDVYYAHDKIPPPCPRHSRFHTLLDMFLPASEQDKCLLAALICTPLWYIPGIARPSWIIDSREGKGCGKTTLVELVSQLYGHSPISTTRSELTQHIDTVKKRCVSQKGRDARVFLIDNVTGDFHCDELSGFITAKDITGMAPYGYGEESRPNDLVYCITSNSASFADSDIPERSLFITVRKPTESPAGLESWRGTAQEFIDNHRLEIVSDIIHMLENHTPFDTPCRTRFREFEANILQPCCGTPEMTDSVLDHVAGVRQDSSVADEQAKAISDAFSYEIDALGVPFGAACFITSGVVNTWGRRAINDAAGPEFKGRPIQLVRNLAKAGLLPRADIEFKRLERDGKRERHSGIGWDVQESSELFYLILKNGNGVVEYKTV